MRCSNCGFEAENHAFCINCGQRMPEPVIMPQPPMTDALQNPYASQAQNFNSNPQSNAPVYPQPQHYNVQPTAKKSAALPIILTVLACLMLVGGIGMCVFSFAAYNRSLFDTHEGIYDDYLFENDYDYFSDDKIHAVGEEYTCPVASICLKDVRLSDKEAYNKNDVVYEFRVQVTNLTDSTQSYYTPDLYAYAEDFNWMDESIYLGMNVSSADQSEELDYDYDFKLESGKTADLLLYYSGSEITSDIKLTMYVCDSDYSEISSDYLLTTDDIR